MAFNEWKNILVSKLILLIQLVDMTMKDEDH